MSRTTLCLWPYWFRAGILGSMPVMLLVLPVLLVLPGAFGSLVGFLAAISVIAMRCYQLRRSGRPVMWLWNLSRRVCRFHTLKYRNIVVHYDPTLAWRYDISEFARCCIAELEHLTARFGRPLRGRILVYYFVRHEEVGAIFGRGYGGWALCLSNAIFVANDNFLLENVRHEFGHLYSNRLNPNLPPPLFSEGLCVWLQQTEWGLPIDTAARPLLSNRQLALPLMLKSEFFFDQARRNYCYGISGSFIGFLIRRHGWESFCTFYRKCHRRFKKRFKKCFGLTLEKAEWQWRNEVIVMEVLNRRLGRSLTS